MPEKNQFQTSLSEHDVLAYHSALVNLENHMLELSAKDDLSKALTLFQETVVIENPALKEHINKNINKFQEGIKKYKDDYSNLQFAEWIIDGVRKERKKYDKIYFSNLLKRENPNIEQAENFMDTIYHDDPAYYNTAYAILLESFKELSQSTFKNPNITDVTKKINDVEHARTIVNSLNPNFQIVAVDEREKPYEYRMMDRLLFDGMLSYELSNKTPITPEKAKEIAPLQAHKCLKNLENKYCRDDNPNQKNARIIIELFKDVMNRHQMSRKPLPLLINKVCEELNIKPGETFEFHTRKRDTAGRIMKDKNNRSIWIDPLRAYCREHGIVYPFEGMDSGLKFTHRKTIESDPKNKQAFCEAMETHLIDFCEKHSPHLDSRIITAALDPYKFYPGSEQDLFRFFTSQPLITDDGKKLGPMFSKELHHDRKRIGISDNPNDSMENFILTFSANSNIGEKGIYDYCIALLKKQGILTDEIAAELLRRSAQVDVPNFHVHNQILHGADAQLRYSDEQGNRTITYFLTPTRPKQINPKNKDNYILAMIDTSSIVYDITKFRFQTKNSNQTNDIIAQLKKLGRD